MRPEGETGAGAEGAPHVALFLPALEGGGAENVMVQLANAFHARGLRVEVLLARAFGPRLAELDPAVPLRELGGRGVLAALPALVAYLRRRRPAALLSTLDHANLVAAWSRALARAPTRLVVRQASDPDRAERPSLAGFAIRRLLGASYRRADHVVVMSEYVRGNMIARRRLAPERVSVVANPVPHARVARLAAEPLDDPWLAAGSGPLVVAAGRLHPVKDYPTLLRAVARAAERAPVRLAVLGDGPERAELEALATALGITERVLFAGFRPNPYPWLARADVVALSSRSEGMPNVLLEAMALGTPVVATDCPGSPRELLDHGRLGKLVPVGDDAAMAGAILAVLAGDRPPAADLEAALGRHEVDAVAQRYLGLLLAPAPAPESATPAAAAERH